MYGRGKSERGKRRKKTYDELLIEREHDDQLDRQELRERSSPLELFPRQSIEENEAVQRDSTCPNAQPYTHNARETMRNRTRRRTRKEGRGGKRRT